ncbi:sigma factor-binding protein Crl [Thaumasiovibrio sp. DFM-14]|uniref:sigma factor-binding protein Crl n=1 Tax=Thaumasiovibrio sp. DFM-14 TaxID=3384792 RepID=UPI0039A079AA
MTAPTHGRLMMKLAAIGPYLREKKSAKGCYFFDSLVSCVDAEKAPESREFWGWWLYLTVTDEQQCFARYGLGRYDQNGAWLAAELPEQASLDVQANLSAFESMLQKAMKENFSIVLNDAAIADDEHKPNALLAES